MNVTMAPSTGWLSSVTTPVTLTFPPPPQPGTASARRAATPTARDKKRTRRIVNDPFRHESRQLHRLIIVPAAEVLVRPHVDVLADEPDRAVPEAEVRSVRVVGFEPPGHVPVPQAVGRIDP